MIQAYKIENGTKEKATFKSVNDIPDGIYQDLSIDDYHANSTHESTSTLKPLIKSVAHYKWKKDDDTIQERKEHFDFGNAAEAFLLEPETFAQCVDIFDDTEKIKEILAGNPKLKNVRSCKEYKEWKSEEMASYTGKYIIKRQGKQSMNSILNIAKRCKADKIINKLTSNVQSQYSIFWTDKETGLKLKTRPDICRTKVNIISDVKTIDDASPQNFNRQCTKLHYPIQAIMHIIGVLESGLMPSVDKYYWLALEKEPPYAPQLYEFTKEDQDAATVIFRKLLEDLAAAKKFGKYPAYSSRGDRHGIIDYRMPMNYCNHLFK